MRWEGERVRGLMGGEGERVNGVGGRWCGGLGR